MVYIYQYTKILSWRYRKFILLAHSSAFSAVAAFRDGIPLVWYHPAWYIYTIIPIDCPGDTGNSLYLHIAVHFRQLLPPGMAFHWYGTTMHGIYIPLYQYIVLAIQEIHSTCT
jgi:hypothetical protein